MASNIKKIIYKELYKKKCKCTGNVFLATHVQEIQNSICVKKEIIK
jgi:hypothetical protein